MRQGSVSKAVMKISGTSAPQQSEQHQVQANVPAEGHHLSSRWGTAGPSDEASTLIKQESRNQHTAGNVIVEVLSPEPTAPAKVYPPNHMHHGISLTLCGSIYIIFGVLGITLWMLLLESRDTSLVPLAVPICGVLGGFAAIAGARLRREAPSVARCVFRIGVLLFLFLLVTCIMDTVAYFTVYADLESGDPRAPLVAAAGSVNLIAALFTMFVMGWLCVNLETYNPKKVEEKTTATAPPAEQVPRTSTSS